LSEGARVLLVGAPNAGKSTLLNALVGSERALVHDEPGTTRDVLEAEVEIEGVAVVVVDVAGVRDQASHPVERAGIARALAEVRKADVVVVVTPAGSAPFAPPAGAACVLPVFTKIDLACAVVVDGGVIDGVMGVSALTGVGLPELKREIARALGASHVDDDEGLVQTARQEHALRACRSAVDDALSALSTPDEVVCSELRRAARCLDRLLGTDVSADVLDLVFTRFCIGK
jgi:tRNA modification GTPase